MPQKRKEGSLERSLFTVPIPKFNVAALLENNLLSPKHEERNEEGELREDTLEKIFKAYKEERKKTIKWQNITKTIEDGDTNTSKGILSKLEENEKILKDNRKAIGELKERIEKQDEREKERERKGITTYAGFVTSRPSARFPERKTLHSVVVTSENHTDTGDQVLERLRKVTNDDKGWVKVERVRKAKDRRVIMGYKTEEEKNRPQKRLLEREDDLSVAEIKKDPLLILYSVLNHLKDEELISTIRSRSRDILLRPGRRPKRGVSVVQENS